MISQVIVHIGDEDGISHAPPQFLEVDLHRCTVHAQGIRDFGIEVFLGSGGFHAQQGRRRNIHQASAVGGSVKAAHQGYGNTVTVHESGRRDREAGFLRECHRQDLALGDGALVLHTWKFSDRQHAVLIDHGAFGPETAERCAATPQIVEISHRFRFGLHRTGSRQQVAQLQQRRRRPPAGLGGALEDTALITKSQRTHPAVVIHRQKKIDRIEPNRPRILRGPAGTLPPLPVIAEYHAPTPTIRFGVGERRLKNRARRNLPVKLHAGAQRQGWVEGETFLRPQPGIVVRKRRMLPRSVLIVVQRADGPTLVPEMNLERAFHRDVGDFFTRTRLGNRASSSCWPTSSRRASIRSPSALPKPKTKSAIAYAPTATVGSPCSTRR